MAGSEPTDGELWSRGDAQAFGVLFERHARAVYNHCFRATANWAEAEDAAPPGLEEDERRRPPRP